MFSNSYHILFAAGLTALVYTLYHMWYRLISFQGIPTTIPWAGDGQGCLQRCKTSLKSVFGLRNMINDGYFKYSKNERPFIIPNIFTGPEVILPMSQMQWLLSQPTHVLCQEETNRQFLCSQHMMLHPKILGQSGLVDMVHRELTRNLDSHAFAIVDEIEQSLEDTWGSDTANWNEVSLYSAMVPIIGRLVSRVFVGLPYCRDPEYLKPSIAFAGYIAVTAGFLNLFPSWLQPLLAPVLTAYDTFQYHRIARIIKPLVRRRSVNFELGIGMDKQDPFQPNDFIQWTLREAYCNDEMMERTSDMVTKRLAVMGFAAIQSSAITITNALFDIAASDSSLSLQQDLRLEAQTTASHTNEGFWNRAALAEMIKIDSTLRESLRLWGFVSHGVTKVVFAKDGITLPSGEHLPRGAKCGIASYGPHHDPEIYDNPYTFDPFRFSRMKEKEAEDSTTTTTATFATTTDYYMGFSHGRHACPGRFFASQLLKLCLAHIVMNYDIEPLPFRPDNPWLNNTAGPPVTESIRVRRRHSYNFTTPTSAV